MTLENSPTRRAEGARRITGALYLAFIVTSVLADALGHIGVGRCAANG